MRIYEIYSSINGEVSSQHQGSLCTFLRMSGCNFVKNPCKFCDTPQALDKSSGRNMSTSEILKELENLGNKNIVITGGEPLRQQSGLYSLLWELHSRYYSVSVETNGSVNIHRNNYTSWVVDYKLPSSGNESKMKLEHFKNLESKDFVKFVVSDRVDFDRALLITERISKGTRACAKFAFSPCQPILLAETLQEWMQESILLRGVGAILSLQLHKIIGVK